MIFGGYTKVWIARFFQGFPWVEGKKVIFHKIFQLFLSLWIKSYEILLNSRTIQGPNWKSNLFQVHFKNKKKWRTIQRIHGIQELGRVIWGLAVYAHLKENLPIVFIIYSCRIMLRHTTRKTFVFFCQECFRY